MSDDVDPENPRPDRYYPGHSDHEWHYVPDDLAETIKVRVTPDEKRKYERPN